MANFKVPKSSIFFCQKCDYNTSRKSQYERHLSTDKHRFSLIGLTETNNLVPKVPLYNCQNCGTKYKHQSSLCKHKKNCYKKHDSEEFNDFLMKENAKLKKMLIDVCKNATSNTITNSCNNNKTFNLNLYLNETCKDAMNIMDFVSSIQTSLEDLETTGKLGYVEGISNIILNNMKNLDTHNRPIHCSDIKREVLYIRNNDQWTKENGDKPILTNAIKVIANENIKKIKEWKQQYPDCTDPNSKKNNMYLKIVSNSMSGGDKDESNKNMNKIISNIAKEVIIDK